jgi:hypothetical protein
MSYPEAGILKLKNAFNFLETSVLSKICIIENIPSCMPQMVFLKEKVK